MKSIKVLAAIAAVLAPLVCTAQDLSVENLIASVKKLSQGGTKSNLTEQAWTDVKSNQKGALKRLQTLAQAGDDDAQNYMGWLYDNGQYGVKPNPTSAVQFFRASSNQGNQLGDYNLGVMSFYGRGVTKDEVLAYQLFTKSSQKRQVVRACVRSAVIAIKNKEDERVVIGNIQCAADLGNPTGFYLMGRREFNKAGYQQSLEWLEKAANGEDPNAPWLLSKIYAGVPGVTQNVVVSAGWWLIGAQRNPNKGGVNASSLGNFSLSDSDLNEARHFAEQWQSNHQRLNPINYSLTITDAKD